MPLAPRPRAGKAPEGRVSRTEMGGERLARHAMAFLVPMAAAGDRAHETVHAPAGPLGVREEPRPKGHVLDPQARRDRRDPALGCVEIAHAQDVGEGRAGFGGRMDLDPGSEAREHEIRSARAHPRGEFREDPFADGPSALPHGRRRVEVDLMVESGLETRGSRAHRRGPLFFGAARRSLVFATRAGGGEDELDEPNVRRKLVPKAPESARAQRLAEATQKAPIEDEDTVALDEVGFEGPWSSRLLLRTSLPQKKARTTRSGAKRLARSSNIRSSWVVPYPATPKLRTSTLLASKAGQRASPRSRTAPTVSSKATCLAST